MDEYKFFEIVPFNEEYETLVVKDQNNEEILREDLKGTFEKESSSHSIIIIIAFLLLIVIIFIILKRSKL